MITNIKAFFFVLVMLGYANALSAQDVFEIKFVVDFTQYRVALLLYENGTGKMRVRYYSDGTKMVEQSVRVENTEEGIRIAGYNPVYPGTSIKFSKYIPDNFYLSIDEYGNYSITNKYDGGNAKASIIKLKGRYEINRFLKDFNWQL